MSSSHDGLEARMSRLEAIEAIKNLKARYWYCCDHKDVEGVRSCEVTLEDVREEKWRITYMAVPRLRKNSNWRFG